jgi:hypothetical protein
MAASSVSASAAAAFEDFASALEQQVRGTVSPGNRARVC